MTKKMFDISKEIRKDILTMLNKAGSGHTAGSLGMTDVFAVLYSNILKYNPKNLNWQKRDYVFLSNGHICPVLYATLANFDFFSKNELLKLRKIDALLQGHPHIGIPGIENSSGPLAQGLSMGVGAAVSLEKDNKNNRVFVFCGDGELNEGQVWEAFLFAAKYSPKNLTIIIDYNGIQLDGNTKDILDLENLYNKISSFNLDVVVIDGHNFNEIKKTLSKKQKKPLVVLAKTIPGKGVSFMENDYNWHGKAPNNEELRLALNEIENG